LNHSTDFHQTRYENYTPQPIPTQFYIPTINNNKMADARICELINRVCNLIFVVPCIMLNSKINPTRCNNCVYSSQWLYMFQHSAFRGTARHNKTVITYNSTRPTTIRLP
jgi:hypothetical protein